jgi:hypothetical protein
VATYAQIVKRSLGALFIAVLVSWIPGIAVYPVACDALHEHGHAAALGSLMMTSNALGALLRLMRELAAGIQVHFVMPVPEQNCAARSLEIKLDDSRARVIGLDPVAISLTRCRRSRPRPRRQKSQRCDHEQNQNEQLETHQSLSEHASPSRPSLTPDSACGVCNFAILSFCILLSSSRDSYRSSAACEARRVLSMR